MPLRVYVAPLPAGAYPGNAPEAVHAVVRRAVVDWQDVVRPGVPSFVFVDAKRDADFRFAWVGQLRELRTAETRLPSGGGSPRVVPIRLATRWDARVRAPLEALAGSVRHEVGHALGLAGHSPEPSDLMGPVRSSAIERDALSERDRETLRLLYGYAPGQVVERHAVPRAPLPREPER